MRPDLLLRVIYLHKAPVDFRKSINGLAVIVEDAMQRSPFSTPSLFAGTSFHVHGEPDKLYDIDCPMDGSSSELKVYDTEVHNEPRSSLLYGC
jgi:hypothetical protein